MTGSMTKPYIVSTIYDGIVSSYKMAEIDVRLNSWRVKIILYTGINI